MTSASPVREVVIRNRPDGVTDLSPRLRPLNVTERWMVIVAVAFAAWGFFLAGAMPAPVLLIVLSCCLVGEVVVGAKLLLLALLRPQAKVVEIPRFRRRRVG